MKSIATIIVIALSSTFSAQVDAQPISEASVREFLVKLDRAIAAQNATEVDKLLSEDADFSGTINVGGRARPMKYNKAQYMAAVREGWTEVSNRTYRRTNEEILVSGDKATVRADVLESGIWRGQYVAVKTKEVWTLERRNGVLVLTRIVATGLARGS